MKTGILTFHRAHNYGAVLQCYALQEILTNLGCEVEIIDYKQYWIEYTYKLFSIRKLISYAVKFWRIPEFFRSIVRARNYKKFRADHLKIRELTNNKIPLDYDAYIIGSDQLFNINITKTLDNVYTGHFEISSNSKRIGYAISGNISSLEKIGEHQMHDIVSNFSSFSFREESLSRYVKENFNVLTKECIDPTLLTGHRIWEKMTDNVTPLSVPYLAFYQVRYPKKQKNKIRNKAKLFAKENNLKFIDLSKGTYPIDQWVQIIKNAKCVITSSFHATVFSLIFSTPFLAVKLNDGGDSRYVDLLNDLDMMNNIVDIDSNIVNFPSMPTDMEDRLKKLRESSLLFLREALSI